MAVIVDATGTKLITTVAGASVNYTGITVGTGADRALVVTVACAAAVTAPNAHWDTAGANQAMTLITAVETQTNVTTFMFGLRNPVAGNKTLNVAWTTSAKSNIEAISFTDVDQTSDARAFINANFVKDAATVASILMGLTSPADSIAVASYGTSATFSSLTGTNLFTDTTNTGCEGAASRSNGAGATINFTGADTGTTGNKVMVGFVVAPVIPVLHEPWQNPVRPKIAGALAIAIMASGLFSAPLPVKEDIPKQEWTTLWQDPVQAKRGLAAHEQQFLAWSTFTPATASTAIVASEDGSSGPVFKYRLIYKAKTEPIVFAAATTPTGWNDPLEVPVRNWQRSTAYTAPFLALGVPPAQVWFPYDRWPDTAPAAKRVAQNPDWSYGTFITPTFIPTYTQWTQWPDFALRKKPAADFIPWTFLEPAPQVFFPYAPWDDFARRQRPPLDTQPLAWNSFQFTTTVPTMAWTNWPDFASRKPQPLDTQPLIWSSFTPATVVSTDIVAGENGSSGPIFKWRLIYRVKTEPVFVPSVAVTTVVPDRWPDFAPKKPTPLNYDSLTLVQLAPQVWFPPNITPDFAPAAKRTSEFPFLAFVAPQPPWNAWTNWPDLVPTRKKPVVDFQPWVFIEPPPQVFFPYGPWDDFARKKPQPLDTQPLAYGYFLPAPTFFLVPDRWPDFAAKKKPPLNYDPLAFLQTVRSPFNSFVNWPDFATKKRPPLNYDPLTFVQTVRTPWNTMTTWPDFAPIRGKIGLHPAQQQFTARFVGTITGATVTITMSAFEVNTDGAAAAILVVQSQPAVDAAVAIKEIGILGGSVTP